MDVRDVDQLVDDFRGALRSAHKNFCRASGQRRLLSLGTAPSTLRPSRCDTLSGRLPISASNSFTSTTRDLHVSDYSNSSGRPVRISPQKFDSED